MTAANDTASVAQEYIGRGWAVIQLHDVARAVCSCGSADEPNHSKSQGGKHPIGGGWQNAGMRDPELARRAWAGRPEANIGIVTGRASGIWVLDVDPEHGGDEKLAELCAANGSLPRTYVVQTGSGGRHYYFLMPDFDFTTSRGLLPVGLDVRGNRGQVVAPPSFTLKGTYRVIANVPIAAAPDWLLAMIRPPERVEVEVSEWTGSGMAAVTNADRGSGYARAAVERLLYEMSAAPPGTRNDTAYRVGRRLAELVASGWSGLDGAAVFASFMNAALVADVDGGFSQTEAEQTLRKAIRDQAGRGVALPEADFYGTPVPWPMPNVPPGITDVTGNGGPPTDFDQAGQGPANPFTSPGGMGPSIEVAAPLINDIAEQQKYQDEIDILRELRILRARTGAKARLDAEVFARRWRKPITVGTLTDELALPIEELVWRVAGLLPADGNAVLVAPRKAGKTTLVGALIRSLVDGVPFLGRYLVEQVDSVALFNYENTARQQRQWLRELGIVNTDRVHILHLRGTALALNVPDVRRYVTDWLGERKIQVWIPDPYARAGQGVILNENDNGQANEFTGLLDEIKAEAGVREIVMPAHSSNKNVVEAGAETSRGAGRLEDWADALWYLNAVEGQRYLRATGRDVELDETQLYFEQSTRSLTIGSPGRGRREVALEVDASKINEILMLWTEAVPATQNDLENASGWGRGRVVKAVESLVKKDLAWTEPGPNRSKYHHHGPKPY